MGTEVAAKEKQLIQANGMRSKERTDFQATEKELVTAVDQPDRALTIIKRETSFAQGGEASQKSLNKALSAIGKVLDAGRVSMSTRKSLQGLMQTGAFAGNDEYQKLYQPQAKEVAYESKSGGIIEKIPEMKEKAEETLTGARNAEMKAEHDFGMLEQSISGGIAVAKEKISDSKSLVAAMTEAMS